MTTAVSVIGAEKTVELPDEIFAAKVNVPLIHQVVVAQQAAARQGSHAAKTRGEVRGGGKKPYRQKGTGRARQGSLRAPQYAGGGVVHGPVPRSYKQRTPKKMKAAALRGALSDRMSHGRIAVVSAFVEGEEPSTKGALTMLRTAVGVAGPRLTRPVLVVASAEDELTRKSLRNAAGVRVLDSGQLNTYDVLASDHVVFTQAALGEFVTRATGEELAVVEPAAKPARKPAAKPKKASADEADEASSEPADSAGEPADGADEPAASVADEPTADADELADDAAGEAAKPAKAATSRAKKPKEEQE